MNRKNPPAAPKRPAVLIEALEPRIAPAGLLNESKFTSVAVGGTLLLDASGAPGTFQGLTTGSGGGAGSYLLYLTSGRALVFTTDINGNGRLDPGEITGISLGKDSLGHDPALLLFSDVNGDIVTNLDGTSGSNLTDSDHNPNNGRDGQLLTDTNITSITLRTLTASDIDPTIPGNTTSNRLALTSFSIHGNIVAGGNIGGVSIDTSGIGLLTSKFNGSVGDQLFHGATPSIGGIFTGTAANNLPFHFTQANPTVPQVEGILQGFHAPVGEHGGDIANVKAASASTTFSVGTLATGDGGTGARGGDLNDIIMNGAEGGYQLIAGNGGDGIAGGQGGSIHDFNDLGSVTSDAVLHTGNGGTGLLGAGGAGGVATFATTDIAAGVHVYMGNGGGGFGNGGTGASFNGASFNTPETATPVGVQFFGTWHNLGDVGNTHPLPDGTYAPEVTNFNGIFDPGVPNPAGAQDNYGDGVFTTTAPNAVNVVFGDGFGGLSAATVSLKVPGVTNPIVTIGDFNGDGRPDIAVASGDPNNFGGVYVFLDQIGTALDPITVHNFTHSAVGDHPFSAAMQTALPTLSDLGAYQSSGAVVALAAGDYNGDGITDIAYVQNVTFEGTFVAGQTIGVLFGDGVRNPTTGAFQHFQRAADGTPQVGATGNIIGSGYFYANPAGGKAASTLQNVFFKPGTDTLQASSLTNANLPDAVTGLPAAPETLFFTQQGKGNFTTLNVGSIDAATHAPLFAGLLSTTNALGKVDTNRTAGQSNDISLADATIQALTIQDVDQDGHADVLALTKAPQTFLVGLQGDGQGNFAIATNKFAGTGPTSNENSGLFLGTDVALAFAAVDTNTVPAHAGTFDSVGVLFEPGDGPIIKEYLLRDATGAPSFYYNVGGPTAGRTFILDTPVEDLTVRGLDAFYAIAPTLSTGADLHPDTGYGAFAPESSDYRYTYLNLFSAPNAVPVGPALTNFPSGFRYLTSNGYDIHAGDGGNAVTGTGGNAGIIGLATASVGSGTGAVAINFPAALSYQGTASLFGGNGGNGYAGGGIGGDVVGVTTRYAAGASLLTSTVGLQAGFGGSGVGGDGGRGGNLSLLSIETGDSFQAGNGGSGLHGGAGGSITGNQSGVFDTRSTNVTLLTGNGGEGALGGGTGGDISKWDSRFAIFTGTGGFLDYTTGAGGGAAGGSGGKGGSIVNSSPDVNENNLAGTLTLATGAGGNGLSGGDGGAITTFVNSASGQSAVPTALSVLTGNGGIGVSGTGGTGGVITSFSSNATGLTNFSGENLTGLARVIAGDGGASYGAAGGVGGSIVNSTVTATSTPLIVAGGAGGNGLTAGGNGGTVTNSQLNSAALQIGKLVVVGGKGGDALAAQAQDITLPNDVAGVDYSNDLAHTVLAFGGTRGVGGNGGNLTNITQPVGAQTAVDLIAGNGGSTINANTATTASTGVGTGGSVTGVILTGTVGAISRDVSLGAITNPPIKSYSFVDDTGATNTSISALVDFLAQPNNFDATNFVLDDSVGNVGIVAGRAGLVRGGQPASDGVNGDVTNITASSIMSIVAGSVDSVAPVRILSGITVTNSDGVLGADKSLLGDPRANSPYGPNGVIDYFNPTTNQVTTSLAAGDSLIDGAIFASQINSPAGSPIRGPRVFPATTT